MGGSARSLPDSSGKIPAPIGVRCREEFWGQHSLKAPPGDSRERSQPLVDVVEWAILALAIATACWVIPFELYIARTVHFMLPTFERLRPVTDLFDPVLDELKQVDPATAKALAKNIHETLEKQREYRAMRDRLEGK